ncbi:DUF3482 domain-containing protein [Verrucomicrobiaceae bacterium N1E253]|uniref:DUF3482 domain-containing protein n=1 Tax=Oceaniferula marina TaxID=2748318 RepID=A0A851GJY0_9BACT|nr:DUF3482 domain-containing protein [Oceaniferula marina]NWK56171.1 DUF3482 domain-containing protein [Oceaniferula marina]
MADDETKEVPVFAVVGKVNTGKSAVLATLLEVDDDRMIRVSNTPGETTHCQELPLVFDGEERIRFVDTPGFQRPIDAMHEIQDLHGDGTPGLESIRTFLDAFEGSGSFEDECQLLRPLVDGAGLLYIIDPSKPLRDEFVAEMEILRWTGRRRMALLNAKSDEDRYLQTWKDRLGSYFNLVRTFNAHQARFEQRRRLLRSLLEIDETHAGMIETTIRCLDDEWQLRREESAEVVVGVLEKAMMLRESRVLGERDIDVEHRRQKIQRDMGEVYYRNLGRVVTRGMDRLLEIYRHHLLEVDWKDLGVEALDLEAEETWSKWGLSRTQLTMAGAATGAAAGAAVDAGTAFLSHGAGALIGALGGGVAAFFKGNALPDLKVDVRGGVRLKTGEGRKLELGPPKNENFAWVLLDRLLDAYARIQTRAHALRSKSKLFENEELGGGRVQQLPGDQRRVLAKWLRSCGQGDPDRGLEPEVFRILVGFLELIEQESASGE